MNEITEYVFRLGGSIYDKTGNRITNYGTGSKI